MPSSLCESSYIFGIHEPGGEKHMLEAGKPGWIVFTEAIGHNPNDASGKDFRHWSNQGLGILCRLNNGYEPDGTIPPSRYYEDFAQRCARYVAASQGCKIWIIGNEMNFHVERPEVSRSRGGSRGRSRPREEAGEPPPSPREDPNRFNAFLLDAPPEPSRSYQAVIDGREVITPQLYARCYRLCRDAIHRVPGHADDQVLIGSVAPWNAQTQYPENSSGDWILYFRHILEALGPAQCDGITLHTYTRDSQPASITSGARMGSFPQYSSSFQTYRDFMQAIPANMRHLPVYITETDQNEAWEDRNTGWVQEAYREIDRWNQGPGNQQIRALILYRWPKIDKWVIETKGEVIKDFREALRHDYRWRQTAMPLPPIVQPAPFKLGQQVFAISSVYLRQTPGYLGKPAGDILATAPTGTAFQDISGPQMADRLPWWRVRCTIDGQSYLGWAAQATPSGINLLSAAAPPKPEPKPVEPPPPPVEPAPARLSIGGQAILQEELSLRRSPGFRNKPAGDILYDMPAGSQVTIIAGPQEADGLAWWNIHFTSPFGNRFTGWAAQASASGRALMLPQEGQAPPAAPEQPPLAPPASQLQVGRQVKTTDEVSCRRSPGFRNKASDDVLYVLPPNSEAMILEGPRSADGLTWWRVRHARSDGGVVEGWSAEASLSGATLLAPISQAPGAEPAPPAGAFRAGDKLYTTIFLNIRRSPGYVGKRSDDVLDEAPFGAQVTLVSGPQSADDLAWWQIRYVDGQNNVLLGWVAEANSRGQAYLSRTKPAAPPLREEIPIKTFQPGDVVFNVYTGPVNVRRTPGFANKPDGDVIGKLPSNEIITIVGGPRSADDLTWWQVKGALNGATLEGWMAEVGSKGSRFLAPAQFRNAIKLGKPFSGNWSVTQLYADRPEVYSKFKYDGVALKGHNGIDFGTPTGTQLLATDEGVVAEVGFEKGGFGNWVKVKHVWGESVYAHMQRVDVKEGAQVARGDVLGLSDNTGNSTGPHLHFGIRIYPYRRGDGWGGFCDPLPLMNPADLRIPDSIRGIVTLPPGMGDDSFGRHRP